ncbi:MAG TPA: chromate transporter [Methylibium sp.]|nr:chromate transporter [Methylibium sp.]
MTPDLLLALGGHFLMLSLLAVGGAIAVAPDMHRWMVIDAALLSDAQFAAAIAIAQAAPGPNLLFVPLLGYQVAGLTGAAVALAGIMIPSTTLALIAARWGAARADWPAVRAFKAGMAPLTLALIAATGWLLAAPAGQWVSLALTLAAALLVWRTRLHLLWLIGGGAVFGAAGWV